MFTVAFTDPMIQPLQWGAVLGASLVAATTDVSTGRIPNKLVAPVAAAGLLWACCTGGLAGLAGALVGAALLMLPFVLLFILAGGGAGDAKLMGALGLWLGPLNAVLVLPLVLLAGVVLALALSIAHKRMGAVLHQIRVICGDWLICIFYRVRPQLPASLPSYRSDPQGMPYGLAIFLGVGLAAVGAWLCHT